MPWHELQSALGRAVRSIDAPVPAAIAQQYADGEGRRFNVYRNNHVVGLVDALASRFPVVHELVGDEFFRGMARLYVSEQPPANPLIIHYGETFPDFIAAFPPAARLPFLSDVARLEYAMGQAYHAADREPSPISELARFEENAMAALRLELHPSLRLIKSHWPVFSLWSEHQKSPNERQFKSIEPNNECGVVVRPRLEVEVHRLSPDAFEFISLLSKGATLEAVAETLGTADADAFAVFLQFAFTTGLVGRVLPAPETT